MGNSQSQAPSSHEEGSESISDPTTSGGNGCPYHHGGDSSAAPVFGKEATNSEKHHHNNGQYHHSSSQYHNQQQQQQQYQHNHNQQQQYHHQHQHHQHQHYHQHKSENGEQPPLECPVKHHQHTGSNETYNVYGKEIDPKNMMAPTTNQKVYPEQQAPLSVERRASTILKHQGANSQQKKEGANSHHHQKKEGTDSQQKEGADGQQKEQQQQQQQGTWLYPSEQMFYNALKRKGKFDEEAMGSKHEEQERYIRAIVAIHNGVNEQTWAQIMRWERTLHADKCAQPTLVRFQGKPRDWSPMSRFKHYVLRYPKPFDRHDWLVDRCGHKQQRYVIDYYYDEKKEDSLDEKKQVEVNKDGFLVPRKVIIDARPALDDVESFWDRCKFIFMKKKTN